MFQHNITRLSHLREVAKRIPPDRLDMCFWASDCGSVACLGGWAALDREFNEQGLWLDRGERWDDPAPIFGLAHGFQALTLFFGLTEREADWLFHAGSYQPAPGIYRDPPISELVEHIDQVLAGDLRGPLKALKQPVVEEVGF